VPYKARGFSLVELMVVVAIAMIVAGITFHQSSTALEARPCCPSLQHNSDACATTEAKPSPAQTLQGAVHSTRLDYSVGTWGFAVPVNPAP